MNNPPPFRNLISEKEKRAYREILRIATEKLERSRAELEMAITEIQINTLFWFSLIMFGKIEFLQQLATIEKCKWSEELESTKQHICVRLDHLTDKELEYETELLPYIYLPN